MSTAALPPPKKKRRRGKGRGRGVDGTGDPVVAEAQVKVSVLAATAKQDTPPSRWQKLQKLQQKVRRVRDQGQVIRARGSDASGSRAENGTRGPVKDVEMVHIGPGACCHQQCWLCGHIRQQRDGLPRSSRDGEGPGAGSHDKHFSSSTRSDACFVPLLRALPSSWPLLWWWPSNSLKATV